MTEFDFDFGFSAVDEDELEAVQKAQSTITEASSTAEQLQARLDKLYNSIIPLLTNLKKNPEKEYILWPDRTAKVEAFEAKLFDIYSGK
jgi:hypothetical protein